MRPTSTKSPAAVRREPVVARPVSAPLAPPQTLPYISEAVALVAAPLNAAAATTATAATAATGILRSTPGRIKVKPNSLLAARAETEYVYVGRDLRKIVKVGASLFGILIVLWILLVVMKLSGLY